MFLIFYVEVGDFVEQDEEITSIETDKVCASSHVRC